MTLPFGNYNNFTIQLNKLSSSNNKNDFANELIKIDPKNRNVDEAVAIWMEKNQNNISKDQVQQLLYLKTNLVNYYNFSESNKSLVKIKAICNKLLSNVFEGDTEINKIFQKSPQDEKKYIIDILSKCQNSMQIIEIIKKLPAEKLNFKIVELLIDINKNIGKETFKHILKLNKETTNYFINIFISINSVSAKELLINILKKIDNYDYLIHLIRILLKITESQRSFFIETTFPLIQSPNTRGQMVFLYIASDILKEGKTSLQNLVYYFKDIDYEDYNYIIEKIEDMDRKKLSNIIESASTFSKDFPDVVQKVIIIELLSKKINVSNLISTAAPLLKLASPVSEQPKKYLDMEKSFMEQDWRIILNAIKDVPEYERSKIIKLVKSEFPNFLRANESGDLLRVINIIPQDERVNLINIAKPILQKLNFQIAEVLSALNQIPKDERANVIQLATPLIHNLTRGSDAANILLEVNKMFELGKEKALERITSLNWNPSEEIGDILKKASKIPFNEQSQTALSKISEVPVPQMRHEILMFYLDLYEVKGEDRKVNDQSQSKNEPITTIHKFIEARQHELMKRFKECLKNNFENQTVITLELNQIIESMKLLNKLKSEYKDNKINNEFKKDLLTLQNPKYHPLIRNLVSTFQEDSLKATKSSLIKQAISKGDLDELKKIMKFPDDFEIRDEDNNTPFINAIMQNQLEIVKFFIQSNVDVEKSGANESTPLMFACENGNVPICELLLANHANVNAVNNYGFTPLLFACFSGHDKIIDILLKAKAVVNVFSKIDVTPLILATSLGHDKIVAQLLDAKADVNAHNSSGQTPLIFAVAKGHVKIVGQLLEANADVNARDNQGQSPLILAASLGHDKIVAQLLDAKADVNARDNQGQSPLILAASLGHDKIVAQLLEANADVNARNNLGQTPLNLAVYRKNINLVKLLLGKKADPNIRDANGLRAIHWAHFLNYPEIVELFKSTEINENFLTFFAEEKTLCHRFGVNCKYMTENKDKEIIEAEMEGLTLEYSTRQLIESLKYFQRLMVQKYPEIDMTQIQDIMLQCLDQSNKSISAETDIQALFTGWSDVVTTFADPLLGVNESQAAHGTGVLISKSLGLLIKCNRGGQISDQIQKSGMHVYTIGNKEKIDEAIQQFKTLKLQKEGRNFFLKKCDELLDLKQCAEPMVHKDQHSGNCAWASAKLLFRGVVYLMLRNKQYPHDKAEQLSRIIYKEFTRFDREHGIIQFINAHIALKASLKLKTISDETMAKEGIIPQQVLEGVIFKCIRDRLIDSLKRILDEYPEMLRIKQNTLAILSIASRLGYSVAEDLIRVYRDKQFLSNLTIDTRDKKNITASDLINLYKSFQMGNTTMYNPTQ